MPPRDLEDLRREVDALSHFDERPSKAFRTPRILASELSDTGDHWLLTEPVLSIDPRAVRTDELRRLADSIGADTLRWCPRDALLDLPWWQELERQRDVFPRLFQDLRALVPDGLHVARVHGDFGAHNVLASPRGPVVIDWEYSSDTGPAGADHWFARATRASHRCCGGRGSHGRPTRPGLPGGRNRVRSIPERRKGAVDRRELVTAGGRTLTLIDSAVRSLSGGPERPTHVIRSGRRRRAVL